MELIVKIGADQAGLQQTIERMKADFRAMNISVPVSWKPQAAAMERYGGIMKPDDAPTGLAGATGATLAKRGLSLMKGMLLGELTGLAAQALDILGQKFWEKVYGVDEATNARIKATHDKIIKSVKSLMDSRETFAEKQRQSILQHVTPETRIRFIEREKAEADKDVAKKTAAYQAAQSEVEALRSGETRNAITGEKVLPKDRQRFVFEAADAERAMLEAKSRKLKLDDELQAALKDQSDESLKNAKEDKDTQKKQDAAKSAKAADKESDGQLRSGPAFQADQLAQAGLFAGSALLQNPALNIEQAQLNVLQEISGKLERTSIFSP